MLPCYRRTDDRDQAVSFVRHDQHVGRSWQDQSGQIDYQEFTKLLNSLIKALSLGGRKRIDDMGARSG